MQMLIYDDQILNLHVPVINCMYAYNKLTAPKQIFMIWRVLTKICTHIPI